MREVFAGVHHAVPVTPGNVLGILSLIFWTLILIVTLKYAAFILRADNNGEGGVMALMALVQRVGDGRADRPSRCSASSVLPCSTGTGRSRRRSPCCRRWRGWRSPRPRFGPGCCRLRSLSCSPCFGSRGGDGAGRQAVRADHDPVVRHPGRARRRQHRRPATGTRGPVTRAWRRLLPGPAGTGLFLARRRHSRGDGCRGPLCRHGALRPPARAGGLGWPGVSGAHPELPRPRGAVAGGPHGRRAPVLRARPRVGALPSWCWPPRPPSLLHRP